MINNNFTELKIQLIYLYAGFGDAWSKINITIVEEDIGATYRCDIDVGLIEAAATENMVVRLGDFLQVNFHRVNLK